MVVFENGELIRYCTDLNTELAGRNGELWLSSCNVSNERSSRKTKQVGTKFKETDCVEIKKCKCKEAKGQTILAKAWSNQCLVVKLCATSSHSRGMEGKF